MIGLDTNVLVRLFTADDARQWQAAVDVVDQLPDGETCFVNLIALVELLWVLKSAYRFGPSQLATAVSKLTEHPRIKVHYSDMAREAAHRCREDGGDIADHLLGLVNLAEGCSTTRTFDRDAAEFPEFTLLSA